MNHKRKKSPNLIKRSLVTLSIMLVSLVGFNAILPTNALAATCGEAKDSQLFDFPTWSRGLAQSEKDGVCSVDIQSGTMQPAEIIFIIALNLIDIALRIVGILAVGYLIYGGFRYVTSRGSADETKKAQDIILKAVIGLVIAILSAVIVSFAVSRLGA